MNPQDVVVLIPGFLGFDRIGHFPYFAARVGAALRGSLYGQTGVDVPVVPVKTCPTESLAHRQIALVRTLHQIDCQLGPVARFHLVGHSTGGVDAYLVTGSIPLARKTSWSTIDPTQVRKKIRSVVSIASPHYGTCLALSSLARFIRRPLCAINKSPSLVVALWQLAFSLRVDEMALGAVLGAVADNGSAAAYILDVLRSSTLVDNLQPNYLVRVHDHFAQERPIPVRSVVTVAGEKTPEYAEGCKEPEDRGPDPFFRTLYRHAAGSGFDATFDNETAVTQTMACIQKAIDADRVIRNCDTILRPVTPQLNDGLVNAARQMVDPTNPDELLTVVVGDHIDVIGYYPQWVTVYSTLSEEKQKQLRSGILHSGSGFGDKQFFQLYQQIATFIASQSQDS